MQTRKDITQAVITFNNAQFTDAEYAALYRKNVRIIALKDEDYNYKDLAGDCYNAAANPDISPEILKRQENNFKSRIRSHGVWGIGLAQDGEPIYHTFVWGFVGNDGIGSGYDLEILALMREFC